MRVTVLVLALLGLTALPDAGASALGAPPTTVIALREDDETVLTWTPVVGASSYVVFAGAQPDLLEPIGESVQPMFRTTADSRQPYYGVATRGYDGEVSGVHVVNVRGDCVATSTSLQMSVSLQGCMNLIP